MTTRSGSGEAIRTALKRARNALSRMDSVGRGTARTRATVRQGLTCDVVDGPWRFVADMPAKAGGGAEGPDPGVYGRAALASCLAVGYTMWAAERGIDFDSLEVEVQADYDARPEYGVGDGTPGYEAIRWVVRVQSSAPENEVLDVLRTAETRSPFLALFRNSQELTREIRIEAPED